MPWALFITPLTYLPQYSKLMIRFNVIHAFNKTPLNGYIYYSQRP